MQLHYVTLELIDTAIKGYLLLHGSPGSREPVIELVRDGLQRCLVVR